MLRAFLFDIGNVLLRFDFSLALEKLAAEGEVANLLEVFPSIDRIKLAYEDGQIERSAFLRGAFDVLRYRGTETGFVAAWAEIFEPNTPMVELVERLHGRYRLYLLSNTSDIHRDYIFRVYPFFSLFDAGIYSYEVRASKPSPAIFQQAIDRLGLEPAATFFIDDLLPNIETARSLGFQTHHYHHDQHEALLAALKTIGIE